MNKTIYVCSRYRAETDEEFKNQMKTTKRIAKKVVRAGHDVIVPHLYYPLFLDDEVAEDRELGMESAKRLLGKCDAVFAMIGLGVSSGMEAELKYAHERNIPVYYFRNMHELRDILKRLI